MRHSIISAAVLLACSSSWAQVAQTMTQAGFTGLSITPNANLLGWGRSEFSFDNQMPGIVARNSSTQGPKGDNFVLGFGLLPNFELAGRLASTSLNRNCFSEGCGVRDLSASGKVGIGLDTSGHFHAAFGLTDIGGSVTYVRSYYGVLTYDGGPFEASAGLAKRSGNGISGSRSPLNGPFASAAWQPLPLVRAHVEYSDGNAWAGARLFAPASWLPEGWSAHVGVNQRITGSNVTDRHWWGVGLSIPLYKVPALPGNTQRAPLPPLSGTQQRLPAYEARVPAPALAEADRPAAIVATPIPAPSPAVPASPRPAGAAAITDGTLQDLAETLKAKGLEDIYVGRMADGSVAVRANNASYNWNSLDALGAGLGAVARTLGDTRVAYRFILTQRQIPIVAATGEADCLRAWIAGAAQTCTAGELTTPGTTPLDDLQSGAAWVVKAAAPSRDTLRVTIAPVLRTNVGSEFGVLDYSAGTNIGLLLPLWAGATAEVRQDIALTNTSDYDPGGVFDDRRIRTRVERAAFTQAARIPLERWLGKDPVTSASYGLTALTGQVSLGRFGGYFDGAHVEARWEPGEGRHRVTAEGGLFRNANFGELGSPGPRTARPLLAEYRYNYTPTRTYFEATGGNFMNNDLGFQLGMRQWFGDVSVNLYYRRSKLENESTHQFVGIQLSVPLTPRREMEPVHHVQVTGSPRFSQGVETTVREKGSNPVRTGFGVFPPVPSLDATFNFDRAGLLYMEDNVRRIRDAARALQ
ncbi:YjbH domain-containing protein [Ramlibacter sp.]|uniref:YjbH domain-containing protein n=1 Tax=Ramlibacter sp. TaxID=1917967 RepID=UPI0026242439|nr:YjbH domain-containing protein [Ramlibacter sp.]MDB5957092.1 hypothetical protein [Ramlibacter sp.]